MELENGENRRTNQRFDIERTLRAVANGEFRLGRVAELSATSAAIHLDKELDEGTEITLDIEDLGTFSGYVSGPPRDGLVPVKFNLDEKEEDHLIAEIMRIYNKVELDKTNP
ncbi:MAG: PilZ domain-containing protein [Rhodospirillales bacterium]|nr:PilZ domain-containing protein [Rhodospirillales bacterium]